MKSTPVCLTRSYTQLLCCTLKTYTSKISVSILSEKLLINEIGDLDEDAGQLGLEIVDDGVGVVAGELKQV